MNEKLQLRTSRNLGSEPFIHSEAIAWILKIKAWFLRFVNLCVTNTELDLRSMHFIFLLRSLPIIRSRRNSLTWTDRTDWWSSATSQLAFNLFLDVFSSSFVHFVCLFCCWSGRGRFCGIQLSSTSPWNVERRNTLFGTKKNYSSSKRLSDYNVKHEKCSARCNHTPIAETQNPTHKISEKHPLLICLRSPKILRSN